MEFVPETDSRVHAARVSIDGVAVVFERREEPCRRCRDVVAVKTVVESRSRMKLRVREAVHADDGSPADDACARDQTG